MHLWRGYENTKIFNLQNKTIRIIIGSTILVYTNPLFKKINRIKIQDMHELQELQFYHNYVNDKLTFFTLSFQVQQPSL